MARLRMAVVGVGHLGKEHARILAGLEDVELVGVADVNDDQARTIAERLGVPAFTDYRPLLDRVEAASVVVPTSQHFAVAAEFLRRDIPVLVEKPLAATVEEAEALVELAERRGTLLQVGHIERFNPAFEELLSRPFRPKFVRSERLGPFTGRSTDIGVVLDLMIHDLDLLLTLVRSPVRRIEALGVSLFGGHEDVANARLHFADGCVADITASRANPTPLRCMHAWAAEGYARLDFAHRKLALVQPSARLRRQGLDPRRLDAGELARLKEEFFGRHLEVLELNRNHGDQLTRELQEFVGCVRTGAAPRVGGTAGLNAVALATRVLESLRSHAWEGYSHGPAGPLHLPAPLGPLFSVGQEEAAA
ncbi:MAG TPA: Gfo/Idh/MocA family oxidoreductase [Gemmataceae bacterium]|nr:Gfo/Idh/MocA family oxidoreductase [Gemmataceae bacterium]